MNAPNETASACAAAPNRTERLEHAARSGRSDSLETFLSGDVRSTVAEIADGVVETTRDWPLISDGIYAARYVRHECVVMQSFRGAPRVYVHLQIVEPGEYFGKVLYRAYRVLGFKGGQPDGTKLVGARFIVGPRSDLLKMVCRIQDARVRPDRISLRALKGCVLRVRTRTVTIDSRQQPLPAALQYSVVDEILGRETGE